VDDFCPTGFGIHAESTITIGRFTSSEHINVKELKTLLIFSDISLYFIHTINKYVSSPFPSFLMTISRPKTQAVAAINENERLKANRQL